MSAKRTALTGILFSVAFAALLSATPADAQTANSNSSSNSSSGSASQSSSGSSSGVTLTQNSTVPANTTGAYSYNTSGYTSSDVTVRAAPQVYAPPVSGGNPCTLAVSGGVSVIGWGASAGGTYVDQECATRQKIAMVWNAGFKGTAKELMCNDRATYDAFKTAGEPCAYRQAYEPAAGTTPPNTPTPLPQYQPSPVTMTIPASAPKSYPPCSRSVTDNCYAGR